MWSLEGERGRDSWRSYIHPIKRGSNDNAGLSAVPDIFPPGAMLPEGCQIRYLRRQSSNEPGYTVTIVNHEVRLQLV